MTRSQRSSGSGGTLAIVAGGALLVICCAGPALLAGGAASALGGALHSPWLIVVGALLMAGVAGFVLLRHRGQRSTENCCIPTHNEKDPPAGPGRPTAGSDVHKGTQP